MKQLSVVFFVAAVFLLVTTTTFAKSDKDKNEEDNSGKTQISQISPSPTANPTTTPQQNTTPTPTQQQTSPTPTPTRTPAQPSPTPTPNTPVAAQQNSQNPPRGGQQTEQPQPRVNQTQTAEIPASSVYIIPTPPPTTTTTVLPTQPPADTAFIRTVAQSTPAKVITAPVQEVIKRLPHNFYPTAGLSTTTNRILYTLATVFVLAGLLLLNPRVFTPVRMLWRKLHATPSQDIFIRPTIT